MVFCFEKILLINGFEKKNISKICKKLKVLSSLITRKKNKINMVLKRGIKKKLLKNGEGFWQTKFTKYFF